jgi:hypothetical protein
MDNHDLAVCTDWSRTDITRGSATTVLNRCRDIHQWATEHLDALADYDITAADLAALKKKIDAFDKLQTKPRKTKAEGKAATRRLSALFRQLDVLLNKRLDKLVVKLKESQPEFYEAYRASRSIVGPPSASSDKSASVVSAPSSVPGTKAA